MKILMSHPTGNANVRAAVAGLLKADILAEFDTAIATFPGNIFDWLSKVSALSEFERRCFDPGLEAYTKTFPWHELVRLAASKAGIDCLTKHETGKYSIDAVYRKMDYCVGKRLRYAHQKKIKGVYAYEDGAAETFVKAKSQGLRCFYDLPIGYWRSSKKLLQNEKDQWPGWASTLTGFRDSATKLARKDEELRLADCVFVASRFTANTLKEFPGELPRVEVIPYGFPLAVRERCYTNVASRRLKLLFVGGLSQRKGIANLFDAVSTLQNHIELTIVGQKPVTYCNALNAALAKHRWIPTLPNHKILKLMQTQDVLVFPSLFEGFGLVITEAMSQGTPVITTDRTAGPDLIEHGHNGWLVKAGSTEALRAAIEKILYNPEMVIKVGNEAMETARKRPWEVYGQELAKKLIDEKYN